MCLCARAVEGRKASGIQAWSNWIREDLSVHPYKWLRPDFVPPAPYLVYKAEDSPNGTGISGSAFPSLTPTFGNLGCFTFVAMAMRRSRIKPSQVL